MGSTAVFNDAMALCPLSVSLIPFNLQVTYRGAGWQEGEGKAGSRLVCTAALGMENSTAPVQPPCQEVLSSPWEGTERQKKGSGCG